MDEKDESLELSPVRLIIDQCILFFNDLIKIIYAPSRDLVTKVFDVLKAGLLSLHTSATPLLDSYFNYLNVLFFIYPNPACSLAKALFLVSDCKKS